MSTTGKPRTPMEVQFKNDFSDKEDDTADYNADVSEKYDSTPGPKVEVSETNLEKCDLKPELPAQFNQLSSDREISYNDDTLKSNDEHDESEHREIKVNTEQNCHQRNLEQNCGANSWIIHEGEMSNEHNGSKHESKYSDTQLISEHNESPGKTEYDKTQINREDCEPTENEHDGTQVKSEQRCFTVPKMSTSGDADLVHVQTSSVTVASNTPGTSDVLNDSINDNDLTVSPHVEASRQSPYNTSTDTCATPTNTGNFSMQGQNRDVALNDYREWLHEGWDQHTEEFVLPETECDTQVSDRYLPKPVMDIEGRLRGHENKCQNCRSKVPKFRRRQTCDKDEYESPGDIFLHKPEQELSPMMQIAKTAKEKGYDLNVILECSETLFGNIYLGCRQCQCQCGYHSAHDGRSHKDSQGHRHTEGQGHPEGQGHSSETHAQTSKEDLSEHHITLSRKAKCQNCGAKNTQLVTYCKNFKKLLQTVQERDLVVKDVIPDGNCQLSAVVDQLRVRGNFRFTTQTLREQAVTYLRENPTTFDGTRFEEFLVNQTWDQYLARMEHDGTWGDHIMLNAICNVINMTIVVYGGSSGENETRISPTITSSQTKTMRQKTIPLEPPVIYLGHMDEAHYISLRPKSWRAHLLNDLTQNPTSKHRGHQQRTPQYSMYHIDTIVKIVLKLEYIFPYAPKDITKCSDCDLDGHKFHREPVGCIVNRLHPIAVTFEDDMQDLGILFPKEASIYIPKLPKTAVTLIVPTDTHIRNRHLNADSKDLILEEISPYNSAVVKLSPTSPGLWKGQLSTSHKDKTYLSTSYAVRIGCDNTTNDQSTLEMIAFQCEWPAYAEEWTTRQRPHLNVDSDKTRVIQQQGCHIIPVTGHEGNGEILDFSLAEEVERDDTFWSYSFAVAERYICLELLSEHHKRVFLLFRFMIHSFLYRSPIPLAIEKSVFFFTCENVQVEIWRDQPGRCVMIMLKKLLQGLANGRVPHYFISSVNLLSGVPDVDIRNWLETVRHINQHFLLHLYWALDCTGLLSGELGPFVDGVLADFVSYGFYRTPLISFQISVVPALKDMMREMLTHKQISYAFNILAEIKKQKRILQGITSSFPEIINSTMEGHHQYERYALALYTDMCQHTNVADELSSDTKTDPLSNVLGPEVPDALRSKRIFRDMAIQGEQVESMQYLLAVLKSRRLPPNQIASCLRYYLETYADIAGDNMVIHVCKSGCCRIRHMEQLYSLYIELIALYIRMEQPEEYRPLMDNFARLCKGLQHNGGLRWLIWAWRHLGEMDRVSLLESQCVKRPGENIESVLERAITTAH